MKFKELWLEVSQYLQLGGSFIGYNDPKVFSALLTEIKQ